MPIIRADICVIGDVYTGKTSLIQSYLGETPKAPLPTMFPELYSKKIRIPDSDTFVELFIYDTPAHPMAWQLAQKAIAECKFLILMVASDNKDSFDICSHWVRTFRDSTMIDKPKGVLVVNQMNGVNVKTEEELQAFAKGLGLFCYSVDCSKSKDCDVPFAMLAYFVYNQDKKTREENQQAGQAGSKDVDTQ